MKIKNDKNKGSETMQHFTIKDVLETNAWEAIFSKIRGKKIINAIVHEPKNNEITVEFEYEENILFSRDFFYTTNEEIIKKIEDEEPVNLQCYYIKDFNCSKRTIIKNFTASLAFFDGNTSFEKVTFSGKADFIYATFSGKADFMRATFIRETLFSYATFVAESYFSFATFIREAVFFVATFNVKTDFSWVVFSDETNFICASFNCETTFSNTKFNYYTTFYEVTFGEEASFLQMKLINGIDFLKCNAKSIVFKECLFQNDERFEFKTVEKLVFDNCIIKSTFNLRNYSDYNKIEKYCEIKALSFKNTQNLGRINIDWDKNKVKEAINNNDDTDEEKKEQFAMLKENYHNIGDYESEDKAFVAYMRSRRKAMWNEKNISRLITVPLDHIIEIIGKYATKPSRIVITMAFVWGIFSILFSIFTLNSGIVSNGNPVYFFNGFYFSAITFFTIGFGDIVPNCLVAKILAPIEGALGLFLMSYFTVAVVRKTLR